MEREAEEEAQGGKRQAEDCSLLERTSRLAKPGDFAFGILGTSDNDMPGSPTPMPASEGADPDHMSLEERSNGCDELLPTTVSPPPSSSSQSKEQKPRSENEQKLHSEGEQKPRSEKEQQPRSEDELPALQKASLDSMAVGERSAAGPSSTNSVVAGSANLTSPAGSGFAAPKRIPIQRSKVPFEKGFSQMAWMKLMRTHPDLAGLKGQPPRRGITMQEVKKHRSPDDAWMVLKGKVYNITPYLDFHPGGRDMLMKGAGRDGTSLFNKYHAWVNSDFLMEKCFVGMLDVDDSH